MKQMNQRPQPTPYRTTHLENRLDMGKAFNSIFAALLSNDNGSSLQCPMLPTCEHLSKITFNPSEILPKLLMWKSLSVKVRTPFSKQPWGLYTLRMAVTLLHGGLL